MKKLNEIIDNNHEFIFDTNKLDDEEYEAESYSNSEHNIQYDELLDNIADGDWPDQPLPEGFGPTAKKPKEIKIIDNYKSEEEEIKAKTKAYIASKTMRKR
uniref:Uncharacterized protein n=1 Tax=Cruciviridae sp. TaxID=1955495 RepID=A0A1S6LVJ0_9VIRU|nr:hypothetical protein [Cruciviridae sp.]